MDIKLIKNSQLSSGKYLKGDYVLETQSQKPSASPLSENRDIGLPRARLFLYHLKNNTRTEIAPEFPKYYIGGIYNICQGSDYIYFLTILEQEGQQNQCTFQLMRYHIFEGRTENIYAFTDDMESYIQQYQLKFFIFQDSYVLMQKSDYVTNISGTYGGFFQYYLKLYSIEEDIIYEVQDENLNKNGIDSIYSISDTSAVLKSGFSLLPDNRYHSMEQEEVSVESISIIHTGQFVSDIMIGKNNITLDVIDQAFYTRTFPYVFVSGEYIIYSAVNFETKEEEVFFYHYDTKEVKTCINPNVVRMTDLARTYVINNTPYVMTITQDKYNFVNLNTRNTDISFGQEQYLETVAQDLFILTGKEKKGLFKKTTTPFFEVYTLAKQKLLLKEKGTYLFSIHHENDDLYIFVK